jgi:transposase
MDSITQNYKFRQAVVKYFLKNGVSKTMELYDVSRATVYRWRKKYDGTLKSLEDGSHRPHHHPKEHTAEELKHIKDLRRRNRHDGLVVFWIKLKMKYGYTRTVSGLWKVLKRLDLTPVKVPNPKYVAKPYEQMTYPGQRVQIDVKVVPSVCIVGEAKAEKKKFYQYTAIDEYSRYRYIEAFEEHNTYTSTLFLEHMLKFFKFKVECVQTDNGCEFTKKFVTNKKNNLSMFEKKLRELGIKYRRIRPFTPRHNGKVERSHRKDNEYFYATHTFYSLNDFKAQLERYLRKYNNFPMRPLGWLSPKQYLLNYQKQRLASL